jgi:hypothetical protein
MLVCQGGGWNWKMFFIVNADAAPLFALDLDRAGGSPIVSSWPFPSPAF